MTRNTEYDEDIEAWLKKCQKIIDDHFKKNFRSLTPTRLSIEPGKRYVRIVANRVTGPDDRETQRLVWAFIDATNGDVLKPASWKAPAKHARGNLRDEHKGMKDIGPYGPPYLTI